MAYSLSELIYSNTNSAECAKNRIKQRRNVEAMNLFRDTVPLEYVSIDVLIRTPRRHRKTLVITNRFKNILKSVTVKRMSAVEVAKLFI